MRAFKEDEAPLHMESCSNERGTLYFGNAHQRLLNPKPYTDWALPKLNRYGPRVISRHRLMYFVQPFCSVVGFRVRG